MWWHLTFGGGIFSASKIFLEASEEKKNHRELYQEKRVGVLEKNSLFFQK